MPLPRSHRNAPFDGTLLTASAPLFVRNREPLADSIARMPELWPVISVVSVRAGGQRRCARLGGAHRRGSRRCYRSCPFSAARCDLRGCETCKAAIERFVCLKPAPAPWHSSHASAQKLGFSKLCETAKDPHSTALRYYVVTGAAEAPDASQRIQSDSDPGPIAGDACSAHVRAPPRWRQACSPHARDRPSCPPLSRAAAEDRLPASTCARAQQRSRQCSCSCGDTT